MSSFDGAQADTSQHPKRRLFKLIGGNLVAINEVTRKEVSSIDLRKAVSLVDLNVDTPAGPSTSTWRNPDEEEMGMMRRRPRSWAIQFGGGEEIIFSADKDNEKSLW
jgi:serine/arginine repetitive matrix protein 2